MSRYFDADLAEKKLVEEGFHCPTMPISVLIKSIPSADVRENVRGEWIPIGAYQWKCSNCGEYISGDADCTPYINKHCWNCGAKMEGMT